MHCRVSVWAGLYDRKVRLSACLVGIPFMFIFACFDVVTVATHVSGVAAFQSLQPHGVDYGGGVSIGSCDIVLPFPCMHCGVFVCAVPYDGELRLSACLVGVPFMTKIRFFLSVVFFCHASALMFQSQPPFVRSP